MRLDAALAAKGLARSRTHAQQLIADGLVWLNGTNTRKAAALVTDDDTIAVDGIDHYVSRAAHKLIAALDAFGVDPAGRLVLDAGASTGGFSQVLLERGARRVIALDVGRGQLSPRIRSDERVCVIEGENVRGLTPARLAQLSGSTELPSLTVADLSFISLELVLPGLAATLRPASAESPNPPQHQNPPSQAQASASPATPESELVLLIKPQFEVGRGGVREGIVRSPTARIDAVQRVLWSAYEQGLRVLGLERSPLLGSHGNVELLAHLSPTRGSSPTEWKQRVEEVAR